MLLPHDIIIKAHDIRNGCDDLRFYLQLGKLYQLIEPVARNEHAKSIE